jgi:hypothetical protein
MMSERGNRQEASLGYWYHQGWSYSAGPRFHPIAAELLIFWMLNVRNFLYGLNRVGFEMSLPYTSDGVANKKSRNQFWRDFHLTSFLKIDLQQTSLRPFQATFHMKRRQEHGEQGVTSIANIMPVNFTSSITPRGSVTRRRRLSFKHITVLHLAASLVSYLCSIFFTYFTKPKQVPCSLRKLLFKISWYITSLATRTQHSVFCTTVVDMTLIDKQRHEICRPTCR